MNDTGRFTMPGEAGYESLTLELARKWGADVIRDSDGTTLSDEILDAGYGIYSTVCLIRDHNEWAAAHPHALQQTFLMTQPVAASGETLTIELMKDFFAEQFRINGDGDAMPYWQVYDRTENRLLPAESWAYRPEEGAVEIRGAVPFHTYTVSFLAYRIWEEISMYNHTTNHWDKEHLMQIDPIHPETQSYLLAWMRSWCESHPATTVVRFTSLFYNFVWIWGADERCRNLFTDWASYDFTVSPRALRLFEERYGYALTAEDFINKGRLHVTHMPPTPQKKDWMAFVNDFVISFGRRLIDIVHEYGKKAYVFYDDSWVGVEPYNGRFREFGFDGLIKCVFSGYEARLCAGADVDTHELRLHPYLFPVGLGGAPTFMEGGDPTRDAQQYWISVRRALLRAPVDRIGLGGYVHLTQGFPDFVDCIARIADEFRAIRSCHEAGAPWRAKTRVAVLHCWGKLRSWTLSGHFHETFRNDLIHVNEALSGLPLDVSFLSFEDVKNGALKDVDVVINAGFAGSAWSGGDAWKDPALVEELLRFVYEGGAFLGVNEPSAVEGFDSFFRMAPALGVDEDEGDRQCHGKWSFETEPDSGLMPQGSFVHRNTLYRRGIPFLTDGQARVLASEEGAPTLTMHRFGRGMGLYFASFEKTNANTRLLLNLILAAGHEDLSACWLTDNAETECAYYPGSRRLIVVNNSDAPQRTTVRTPGGPIALELAPYETKDLSL